MDVMPRRQLKVTTVPGMLFSADRTRSKHFTLKKINSDQSVASASDADRACACALRWLGLVNWREVLVILPVGGRRSNHLSVVVETYPASRSAQIFRGQFHCLMWVDNHNQSKEGEANRTGAFRYLIMRHSRSPTRSK